MSQAAAAARPRRGRRLGAALFCGVVVTAVGWAGALVRVSRLWIFLIPGSRIASAIVGARWHLRHAANPGARAFSFYLPLMLVSTLLFWTLLTWLFAWLLGLPREEEGD